MVLSTAFRSCFLGIAGMLVFCVACGPSQEDFDARGARIAELEGQLEEAGRRYAQAQEQIETITAWRQPATQLRYRQHQQ